MKVEDIFEELVARQILDSRGSPTVEIELHTVIGVFRDSCPSGASTGSMEAKALLDKTGEYDGKSVNKAIFNIKEIVSPKLSKLSIDVVDQAKLDSFLNELDGTPDKMRIGANALMPVSLAFARAGAVSKNLSLREHIAHISESRMSLPVPFFNVINGGAHSGNDLAFQEVMIAFFYDSYSKNLEQSVLFYKRLKETIQAKHGASSTGVGDEGGFAPPVKSLEEALDLIMETYERNGFENMRIGIDSAANSFYKNRLYKIGREPMCGEELVSFYVSIVEKYPLIFLLEDPFEERDYASWADLYAKLKGRVRIVGDDLTVTNKKMVDKAARKTLCDTLLVKINQVGTVSEAIEAVKTARDSGMHLMVSHRSGETEDAFMCDFAVGIGSEYIKAGAPCRGERISKYNQLLRIEESIKRKG